MQHSIIRATAMNTTAMNKRRSRSVQATLAGIERLEAERRNRGLTLEALANAAQVAPDTLKRLIRRERVDRNSVRDIVRALELEPVDIVDFQEWNQWYNTGAQAAQPVQPDSESVPDSAASPSKALASEVAASEVATEVTTSQGSGQITGQPSNGLEPDFSLYIERSPIESICQQTIETPGGLLRIKAPQQMGKTALLTRLLWFSQPHYQTVCLSFQLADRAVFSDLNTFLKWFCAVVSRELGLDDRLEQWKDIYSSSYNATFYFQDYLLNTVNSPLVLALDNTDLVFEHEEIATDFCKLLRNWHDLPRRSDRNSPIWQKLRLVIVHATEIYGALDINASPLAGVGVLVDLPELTFEQVQDLVQRYRIGWSTDQVQQFTKLVGGHPYLLQLGLEQIQRQHVTLEQVLQTAHTEAGIYSNHLRQQLSHLEQSPELVEVFQDVVRAAEPIQVKPAHAFKLQSMGLVHLEGNQVKPRCLLYRQYFSDALR